MDFLSEYLSSWADYYESARNDSESVVDLAETSPETTLADGSVFSLLETLSISGLVGNAVFLLIIFRHKHFQKPSYVLLASLAFADIIHCLIMAGYFYPPIVTKMNPFSRMASRIFMSIEWAAWGVTLSHMFALSADRFVAVSCCYSYQKMVTAYRALIFVIAVWFITLALMIGISIQGHCCLIIPAPGYYTFTFEKSPKGTLNIYQKIFVPFESLTFAIVGVVTPVTLMKYCLMRKKLKRDRHGSGSTQSGSRISLSKRESRVLVQIAVVTLIFFLYMINYYLFYYIVGLTSKWETMFNSMFYCFNSMVHPFIYFGFNRLLRKQLIDLFRGLYFCTGHSDQMGLYRKATASGGQQATSSLPPTPNNWSQRIRIRMTAWRYTADNGLLATPSFSKNRRLENNNENTSKNAMQLTAIEMDLAHQSDIIL